MHECVRFGPFEFDFARRVLRRDGEPVPLGSRAADVLCELLRAEGALVAKDALLARVWPDTVVEENNLQVQVSALRKVFGRDPAGRGWVQTAAGRGYRFVAPLQSAIAADPAPDAAAPVAQAVRFVRSFDGVRIAAASLGQGPALVRTGLWMTHLEHEWETPVWGPLHRRLAQRCRLLRYDQRGTGLSDRTIPPLSFDAMVRDLEAVVDDQGLDRFALLGVSQGASTAIEYAARHPQRVACLVLVGGYVKGLRARGDPALAARSEAFETITRHGWGQNNPAFRQLFTSLAIPDASRAEMDAFNELQRRSAAPEVAAQFVRMVGGIDVTPRLEQVRSPTLVVHSRDDAWVPCELGRAMAAGIRGAEFVTIPSGNHIPMPREPAWEPFVARMLEFITTHTA